MNLNSRVNYGSNKLNGDGSLLCDHYFHNLLIIMSSSNTTVQPSRSSQQDSQLEAVRSLYVTAYRLRNITNALQAYVSLVMDESTTKATLKKNTTAVKRIIIPC
jgi:hypothetical protein